MASTEEKGEEELHQENATYESSLERKHAAMLNRLAANQDARLQKSAVRRAESAAEASPLESTEQFLETFSQCREQVEESLAAIQERKASLLSEAEKLSRKTDLEKLALQVLDMEKFVADKSYFLPAYEVRASQSIIANIREDIEAANVELLPKKKFSFRNRTGKPGKQLEGKLEGTVKSAPVLEEKTETGQDPVLSGTVTIDPLQGVQDIHDAVIVRDLKDQEDGEYMISNLSNCKVYLRGRLRALYIHKLKGCHVYAGPVTGSALIEEVESSVLMLASHQIRIHHTKTTDFYLCVRSRPIVEYTSEVRFAPYAFHYHGIQDDLDSANLSMESRLWENVDDFRWLRAVPSPNWSILPEDQRLHLVDGSNIIEGKN